MSNKKSSSAGKFDDAAKAEPASAYSKGSVSRRQINMQMMQNVLLIWLDNNIDNNADYHNTITQLRCAVNTINTFTDSEKCIQFLENLHNDKACMIISGSLGEYVVPRVHNMLQVDSIFIFCDNKKYHEHWIKNWTKIKGIFTEISPIYEALKKAARQCEQDAISISFIPTNDDISKIKLDKLEPSFMYTQILKEILLKIVFEQKHITKFTEYWREELADNEGQLKNVTKFEQKYRDETPIRWYTSESFLYSRLNRSLRLMDVDIIIKMGFFIGDLHLHIEQLHAEQFGGDKSDKSFKVYRGQGISKIDFEKLTKTKGGLISFNSFLSTSTDRDVSRLFAESNQINLDVVGILFVMTIDPSLSSAPFASIKNISHFQGEDEILFSMHTVFRICDIIPMAENHRLFQVNLTLTNDNDKDLRVLTDHIEKETFPEEEGWYRLGKLLLTLGEAKKAEQVYNILLEQPNNEHKTGSIYRLLGQAKMDQAEFNEAITIYKKSINIYEKTLSSNHPDLATSYNNIGMLYHSIGEYSEALPYHEKALAIRQQSLTPNHSDLATSYNNIGLVFYSISEYSKAISSHEKALEIRQQSLPPNHPDLAMSYNNIGLVYNRTGDYSKALSYYEKALEIRQQSLPSNHPLLATSYNSIGLVFYSMGEYSKAASYHEKALEIRQQSLPSNHPGLARSYNNIGSVYKAMNECSKALSYYEKALEMRQQSLSPNHPDLGSSYNNIGSVYKAMNECSKALSYYEKALEIRQQSLPPTHPDLGSSYNNIGRMFYSMGEYSKAVSYHEKALEIRQQSLPSNHPDLTRSYNNIGLVYEKTGNYSKACSYYERAVDIAQHSLPSNHPDLQTYRRDLDRVKNL
jgi:tetratricopeptide (TPR) repeat protein